MTQHIKIEFPSCSPEEKVSHELIKLGISSKQAITIYKSLFFTEFCYYKILFLLSALLLTNFYSRLFL